MAAGSLVAKLTIALLFCMAATTLAFAHSALNCGQVTSNLASCIPYLTDTGPLTPPCCGGVTYLNGAAITTVDRQQVCSCLKTAATEIQNLNYIVAAGLPGHCGVSIPYKISPSIDCSTVK